MHDHFDFLVEENEDFAISHVPAWFKLETVTISKHCSYIGDNVFYGCKNLQNVTFENDLIFQIPNLQIYSFAFDKCISLSYIEIGRSITIRNTLEENIWVNPSTIYILSGCKSIVENLFKDCTKLNNITMQLSDTELAIGPNAFQNCPVTFLYVNRPILAERGSPGWNNIAFIKFTNPVEIIKANTFANCQITNITIRLLTDKIEAGAFSNCTLLEKIILEDSLDPIKISPYAFSFCPSLRYIKLGRNIDQEVSDNTHQTPTGFSSITTVEFGEKETLLSMRTTTKNQFWNFQNLENIDIEFVCIIESNTFKNCFKLKTVTLGFLHYIHPEAFLNCISLESITIPKYVKAISDSAFQNCSSLKSVYFNNHSTTISNYCFLDCVSLTTVSLPGKIESLPLGCFSGCTSLSYIFIPETVKLIGSECFSSTSIECLYVNSKCVIQPKAFESCSKLARIEFLQSSVAYHDSFKDCNSISIIVFEDNVTIEANAFSSNVITNEKVSVAFFGSQGSCPAATAQAFSQLNSINTTSIFSNTTICGIKSNRNPYILPKYKCIIRNQYVTLVHDLIFGRSIFHSLAQTYSIYNMLLGT